VNFLGLLGANGPLPRHLGEYVRDRLRHGGDPTLLAFLDVFHHRMLCAVLPGPRQRRTGHQPGPGRRRPLFLLRGQPVRHRRSRLRERDGIGDFAKLHFAGLLARQARPASGLANILRHYFRLPLAIEQFVGHWMTLPDSTLSRLGTAERGNRIGSSMVLGRRVWDCQNRFRIVIGPGRLPGLPALPARRRQPEAAAGLGQDVLRAGARLGSALILKKAEVPPLRLGGPTRLGWSTWLASAAPRRDPDQLRISRAVIESQIQGR
jgi:type VI secretion system protein ImpH